MIFIFRVFFFISLITCANLIRAQDPVIRKDTIGAGDTIVIYKQPLVISKKVYVEELVEETEKKYFLDFSIGSAYQFINNKTLNADGFSSRYIMPINYNANAILYKNLNKKLAIGTGIQFRYANSKIKYNWTEYTLINTQAWQSDTLDAYVVENPITKEDTNIYIIESTLKNLSSVEQNSVFSTAKNNALYLEIPVQFKYLFLERKLHCYLIGGFIPSLTMFQSWKELSVSGKPSLEKQVHRKLNIAISIGVEMSKAIKINSAIFFQGIYRNDLFPLTPSQSNIRLHSQLFLFNIGWRKKI